MLSHIRQRLSVANLSREHRRALLIPILATPYPNAGHALTISVIWPSPHISLAPELTRATTRASLPAPSTACIFWRALDSPRLVLRRVLPTSHLPATH